MLICLGIAMIAYCALVPQIDENRRLVYECEKLKLDLDQLQMQVAVNQEFVSRVGRDPALAERLAQRQMRFIRKGSSILELEGEKQAVDRSPFALVSLPPPKPLAPLKPAGGPVAQFCRDPRHRLYLIGAGLMLAAIGLILGSSLAEPKR